MADIAGTSARDTLTGTSGADILSGGDGADTINAGDGNDVLYASTAAGTDAASSTLQATLVAQGFANPVFAASAPGDPGRLFVVEQHTGAIKILDLANGAVNAQAFFDLPDTALAGGSEQGLLGLAF